MRSHGIVGTTSPLILTASVRFSNGVGGLVYVGQTVITAVLSIKRTMENMTTPEGSAANMWQIEVWDTRLPDKGYSVLDWDSKSIPTLTDVRNVTEALDAYLAGVLS